MKKFFAIMAVVAAYGISANAAEKAGAWGVHAGVNLSNASISPAVTSVTTASKLGIVVGVHYNHNFNENFAIEPGIQYAGHGYKLSASGVARSSYSVSYIEIPVLFKGKLPMGGWAPYIFAGPNLGIKMSASCTNIVAGSCAGFASSSISSTNIGIDMGLGVDFDMSGMVAFVTAGYSMGLTNTDKATAGTTVKDKGFQFLVGLDF